MSYTPITTNFADDVTVLHAAHLQHMEAGIVANDAVADVAVKFTSQSLTTAQKAVARGNVGAAAVTVSDHTLSIT